MMSKLAPAALALAVVGAGAWWYASVTATPDHSGFGAADAQEAATEADFARVPDMTKGDADAPVTVVEYASFTCPHCATFHRNVFPQLEQAYIDTGKVRYIKREVYFDRFGLWAGMLARCGGEDRYFGMVDLIYDSQREWAGSNDPATVADNLRRLGRRAGLTTDEVDACLGDADQAQAMVAVYQHFATTDQVRATPSFVIDGTMHSNMSLAEFSALIDARLEQ